MRNLFIFNIISIIILLVFGIVYYKFQDMKKFIIDTNYKTNIQYVQEISNNISNSITYYVKSDIENYLKNHPKIKKQLEKELSLFITDRYKYIYVVKQDEDGDFRFLLDGSIQDKAMFLENYEPIEPAKWKAVYVSKTPHYFTHTKINKLWITYLQPIIKNNKVIAILVIDFSMKVHDEIKKALNKLDVIFKILVYFFLFIFIIIILFSYIDYMKTKELKILNKDLENKVNEEIEKNRKKDEQLFYQSKLAQMGEMISMIAHQWRQPLASISATAMGVNIKTKVNDIDKEFIIEKMDSINSYTNYLSDTIEDFRNFFKPAKQKELITFEEILNSVFNIMGNSLKEQKINVKIDIKYKSKILTFSNELKQVLLNLLKNAEDMFVEKGLENRNIYIEIFKKYGYVIIKIKDNAGGIDEEIFDKIFDPYFTTKSSKNGTGLGLYMSKIIVEKHLDGKINVYNQDNGAVFEILIKVKDV